MEISDQLLNAYLDEELADDNRQAIDQQLQRDAHLSDRLNKLQKLNSTLAETYPLEEKVSPQFLSIVQDARLRQANVIPLNRKLKQKLRKDTFAWSPTAIAASITLTVGILLGSLIGIQNTGKLRHDILVTSIDRDNPLYDVLETAPSASEVIISDGDEYKVSVNPVLTFKSIHGTYCREFDISINQALSAGIACRVSDSYWALEAIVATKNGVIVDGTYTPASGFDSDAISQVLDKLMQDDALSSDEEKLLITHGWKQ